MQTASQTAALIPGRHITQTLAGKAALALGGSLLIAVCAHLAVPLPFTPVPLTLSDFAVLVVGLSLAPEVAFAAVVLYLLEGFAGAPVFSTAAFATLGARFAVTGGFLFSYPFAAALVAVLRRAFTRTIASQYGAAALAATAGGVLIMLCGVTWLAFSLHLAPMAAFTKGAAPFLPGQLIKILCAAGIVTSVRRLRTA